MSVGKEFASLHDSERAALRRLAVFDGGWTLDAAQHVCGTADPLRALMEKALVEADAAGGRFRLAEPLRARALRDGGGSNEHCEARDRHLEYFVQLATAAKPELAGPGQATWLARLDAERRNILAAHEWAGRDERHARAGLRLVNSIKLYWTNRGLLNLGLAVTMEALLRPGAQEPTADRAQALFNAGQLRYFMGRHAEARRLLEASLDIARGLGPAYVAAVLQPLGMAAIGEGDFALARRCLDEATQLSQSRGDLRSLAGALNGLGMLYRVQGEFSRARPLYEQVVRLAEEQGNHEARATGLINLAMVAIDMGFVEEARALAEEALHVVSSVRSVPGAQAALDVCAALACREGDWARAVRFMATSDAQASRSAMRRDHADAIFLEPKISRARAMLSPGAYEVARGEGNETPLFAALAAAQAWLDGSGAEEAAAVHDPAPERTGLACSSRQSRQERNS